jgi:hypothetical protein
MALRQQEISLEMEEGQVEAQIRNQIKKGLKAFQSQKTENLNLTMRCRFLTKKISQSCSISTINQHNPPNNFSVANKTKIKAQNPQQPPSIT